jgi:hypothetical protein
MNGTGYYEGQEFKRNNFFRLISFPKDSTCWIWIGSVTNRGYGKFRTGNISVGAHRVAWTLQNGDIPKEKLVCHKCDNPLCVNPEHLFVGDQGDNLLDMIKKGRGGNRGEVVNKFYQGEIDLMKKLVQSRKFTLKFIGKMFKISRTSVTRITSSDVISSERRTKCQNTMIIS